MLHYGGDHPQTHHENRSSLLIKRESRNDSSIIDKRSNDDDSLVNQGGSFLEQHDDELKITILKAKELYNESKLNSLLK